MAKNWDDVKGLIINYYQSMTLQEVMNIMKEHHGFTASQRSYRQKFKDWGVRKYRSHDTTRWSSQSDSSPRVAAHQPQTVKHAQDMSLPPQHPHNDWNRSSPSKIPMMTLRTPDSESGRTMNASEGMMPGMRRGHARDGSNVTQTSSTSQEQPRQLSPWSHAPSGVGGLYHVSMASPMSMPATTSPQQNPYSPSPAQDQFNLCQPSYNQPSYNQPSYSQLSYNQPLHEQNSHVTHRPPSASFATPMSMLQGQQHPRNPYWHIKNQPNSPKRDTMPRQMYPDDDLHNGMPDASQYPYIPDQRSGSRTFRRG